METTNVTPIQNKVAQAVQELSAENQRLREENQRLRASIEEVAAIAVRQAIAVQDAINRNLPDHMPGSTPDAGV